MFRLSLKWYIIRIREYNNRYIEDRVTSKLTQSRKLCYQLFDKNYLNRK